MAEQLNKLACKGCGASLEYAAGQQALKCQYCSAVTEIHREENELENTPDLVIPLTVEQKTLEDAVYQHMASGNYTPDNLVEHAVFSKVERYYVPAYWFTGDFDAHWTASFGYDRTERYTVYESRTENGRTRQVPVTKSRTVTDWNPVNGSDSGRFSVLGYSGSRLTPDLMTLIEHTSGRKNVTNFDPSFVSGLEMEPFAATERDAYTGRAEAQVNSIIDASVTRHAQGDRQRDWHWTASTRKSAQSVIVPICHVIYEYEGKQYHVWADGTDPEKLVADQLPKDDKRKRNVYIGFVPAVAATVALALAGLASDGGFSSVASTGTLAVIACAWGYSFWRRHAVLDYSIKLRRSLLAQRKASQGNMAKLGEAEGNNLAASFQLPVKPWVLVGKKDMGTLVAGTILFCSAIFLSTSWKGSFPGTIYESAMAKTSVESAAPAVVTTTVAAAPVVQEPKTEEVALQQKAAVSDADANEAAQLAAKAAAAAVEPLVGATPASASVLIASTGSRQGVAIDAQKNQPIIGILQAAAKPDWDNVDIQVQSLKSTAPTLRGDRKASRAANGEGLQALQKKDYATAINAFNRAVRADSSDIEGRNNLGYAYLQSGDLPAALDCLTHVLQLVPDRSSAWANMAETLAQSSNAGAADASLRLAIRYSANRKRTVDHLNKAIETHPSDKFRESVARVLKDIDSIPQNRTGAPSVTVSAVSVSPTTPIAIKSLGSN